MKNAFVTHAEWQPDHPAQATFALPEDWIRWWIMRSGGPVQNPLNFEMPPLWPAPQTSPPSRGYEMPFAINAFNRWRP